MINYIIVGGLVLATLILTALLPFCDSENKNLKTLILGLAFLMTVVLNLVTYAIFDQISIYSICFIIALLLISIAKIADFQSYFSIFYGLGAIFLCIALETTRAFSVFGLALGILISCMFVILYARFSKDNKSFKPYSLIFGGVTLLTECVYFIFAGINITGILILLSGILNFAFAVSSLFVKSKIKWISDIFLFIFLILLALIVIF